MSTSMAVDDADVVAESAAVLDVLSISVLQTRLAALEINAATIAMNRGFTLGLSVPTVVNTAAAGLSPA